MPIEIKELHIRVTVDSSQKDQPIDNASSTSVQSEQPLEDVVAKCVEQVIQILKEKTER